MQFSDQSYNLRIELDAKHGDLPTDEVERLMASLSPLDRLVAPFATRDLYITIFHHPKTASYQVKTALTLPGKTLASVDEDSGIHPAFERCVTNLIQQVEAHKEHLAGTGERAKHIKGTYQDVVPSRGPDGDAVEEAVRKGDYTAFRIATFPFEESVRKRVGRWVERYPEAAAKVGGELKLKDVVEAVFLNAFEGYDQRPANVRFGDWLESLIDASLKEVLADPEAAAENMAMLRTYRDVVTAPDA